MSQIVGGTYHVLSFSFFKKEINHPTGSSTSQSHTFAPVASSLPPPHPFQWEPHPSPKAPSPSEPWIPPSSCLSGVCTIPYASPCIFNLSSTSQQSLPHSVPLDSLDLHIPLPSLPIQIILNKLSPSLYFPTSQRPVNLLLSGSSRL